MKPVFEVVWKYALPYLKKGTMKDFVLHTKGVVKAMELLLEKEPGDRDILIPAAILHDVGWAKVPAKLQKSEKKEDKEKAQRLHITEASAISAIIEEILTKVGYSKHQIATIVDIIKAHKFQDPTKPDKRLLADADSLSDAFEEQFNSDIKSYKTTPQKLYKFRKNNKFYTKTAKEIFDKELEKRKNTLVTT